MLKLFLISNFEKLLNVSPINKMKIRRNMHYSGKNSGKLFNSSTKYIKPEFCEVSLRVLQGKMIENKLVIYFYINVQ